MIRDNPQGADLLSEARRVLSDTVLPTLSPDVKYQALMAIRAISLVESQLQASVETEAELGQHLVRIVGGNGPNAVHSIARQIRTGNHDASTEVFDFLMRVVIFKLRETGPEIKQ